MLKDKKTEMRQEAIEAILETLNSYTGYYCDLHNEVFNTDYYIIGAYEAKQALRRFDVFDAIEMVQEYEQNNFGEIYTDFSNPEKLINMTYYIIGEQVIQSINEVTPLLDLVYDELASEEINNLLIEVIKARTNELY